MSHDYIDLPDAPRIPGLRFRQFAGEADYAEMAPMLNEAFEGHDDYWTIELVRHMDGFVAWVDQAKDRIIAQVDGRMIGAGRVQSDRNLEGERIYSHSFNMIPAWRGKGIGTAVLKHNERRISEIAATHPPDGPRFLQSFAIHQHQAATHRLLRRHGYEPVRFLCGMVRPNLNDIPDCPPPAGIVIRPIEESDLRAVWDAKEEAFRDLWGSIRRGEQGFRTWVKDPLMRKELCAIAWEGSECIGTVIIFVSEEENRKRNRKLAYTELISVRRPWRGRGIAQSMIAHALRNIRAAGFEKAGLSVDTQNPSGALKLYEKMGYAPDYQSTIFRKPMSTNSEP
jgi:mycothiol synthase